MNLTNATSVTINNKTVERILINGKTVYNTIQMLLTTNKEHIKTDESAIVKIESNIKNKTIELWKVINMTRTSMGTQTTGSDGKASWTYTGTGAGEVQFIATYDDIESNTVTIEDYNPVITRAVLTADKTTISSSESVTLTCNYFDQYNELTADYYSSALYDGSTSVEMGAWECPDVFTVSGLSVGTHSFKVVVTNQDSSVLDSNVVSVVVEDSFDGMSLGLSAGSQILSYADEQSTPGSQYATLEAQLTNGGSPAAISGVEIEFWDFTDDTSPVLLHSDYTEPDGTVSYTYESLGRGDVPIKAKVGSFLTKTYSISDIIKYDVTEHTYTSAQTDTYPYQNQVYSLPSHYKMQFKLKNNTNYTGVGVLRVLLHPSSDTVSGQPNNGFWLQIDSSTRSDGGTRNNGSTELNTSKVSTSVNSWVDMEMEVNGTSVTFKINGNSVGTVTKSWISNYSNWVIRLLFNASTVNATYKDLKIIPL